MQATDKMINWLINHESPIKKFRDDMDQKVDQFINTEKAYIEGIRAFETYLDAIKQRLIKERESAISAMTKFTDSLDVMLKNDFQDRFGVDINNVDWGIIKDKTEGDVERIVSVRNLKRETREGNQEALAKRLFYTPHVKGNQKYKIVTVPKYEREDE